MLDTQLIKIHVPGFTDYLQTVYPEYHSRFTADEWIDILNFASEHIDTHELEQEGIVQYDHGYEEGYDYGRDDGEDEGYRKGHAAAIEEMRDMLDHA